MRIWTTHTMNVGILLVAVITTARGNVPRSSQVGALEYVEGYTFVNGKAVNAGKEALPILGNGESLRTDVGHAEIILTPGVFLRLDARSEVHLVSGSLTDTRLHLDRGAMMLEVDDLHKDNRIRVETGSGTVLVLKTGLYRFEAEPARVQVLDGRVEVAGVNRALKAGKHREVLLASGLVRGFKSEPNDELDRWSRLRSEYEAEASVASAQYIYDRGLGWGFSDWFWNPWFDSWTWLPASGFWMNPYGFGYWSPFMVYDYYPNRYYGYRRFAFQPRAGLVSPSGLNLQRGQIARAARSGAFAGSSRLSSRGGFGGMRSSGAPMATGRSLGGPAFGGRSASMGGRSGGGRR